MLLENDYDVYSEDEEKMPEYQNFLQQYNENEETNYPSNHNNNNNHFELLEIHNNDEEEYQNNSLVRDLYGSDAENDFDSKETETFEGSEIERESEDYH